MDEAGDQAVAFELAQGFGQHLLADGRDPLLELGEAEFPVVQLLDDVQGPLVGYPVESLLDELLSIHWVSIDHLGAYFPLDTNGSILGR